MKIKLYVRYYVRDRHLIYGRIFNPGAYPGLYSWFLIGRIINEETKTPTI